MASNTVSSVSNRFKFFSGHLQVHVNMDLRVVLCNYVVCTCHQAFRIVLLSLVIIVMLHVSTA